MNIGTKIKVLRKEKKFTLKDLAEKTGLSISFISDIEHQRRNPSLENLNKIAKALGIKISELLDEHNHTISSEIKPHQRSKKSINASDSDEVKEFKTAEDAMKFILEQPALMAFGGYDLNKMSDDEIIEFANELLRQFELISYKYKK
ncbi:helix-turn-helix domain-containing protein (plasmid) [Crassaminicella thermophila]|uniref:Helix-turn-helix domain-containing protein n=1 Tax=Crassaminicella thermophila TaxID=2599308 RepID=A0A5C0SGP9_CRATE|nr:helix-turn-helix transcriptional regulator [Crassaminicella thermophila]QEK13745.1 helix-turn-helix domain-containing protein [Crassaminicella thermophila]